MEGKITFINEKIGKGRVTISKDHKVYEFSLDSWLDIDKLPKVGLLVEAEILNGKVAKINPKNQNMVNSGKAKKEDDEGMIPISMEVEECIHKYFGDVLDTINNYQDIDPNSKQMEFVKLKRFIFTAYNDLYELDNLMVNEEMDQVHSELLKLQKDYDSFVQKTKYPLEYSFDKIFLRRQSEFIKTVDELEYTQNQVRKYVAQQKPINEKMIEKEEELKHIEDKKSKLFLELESEVKSLRKRYVDLLHYIGQMKDKQVILNDRIETFKKKYLEEFRAKYEPLCRFLDGKMNRILNVKAYEFDSVLWTCAKESRIIRRFFMDANIEGTYSSKTFLKYYLRTLDKEKLNKNNKELIEAQKYLDSLGTELILIIRNNLENGSKTKYLIETIDKELKVVVNCDAQDTFKMYLKEKPDIVFLDYDLRTTNAIEYVKKAKQLVGNEKEIKFCMFVDEIEKDILKEASKTGIRHFINSHLDSYETIEDIRVIL